MPTNYGQHLVELKKKIIGKVGTDSIQLITISCPSAYGEYETYYFCDTEDEFEQTVSSMID